jgi:hypothetical protein
MQNRALHDALREFALETAALLTDEHREGAELEFDVADEGSRRGPALYRYRPLTERFIGERWPKLRELPTCIAAAEALGAGATQYLRMNGLRGEQAEPALHAMLERLYEDASSFEFPEERFERVYADVERTLYRDAVAASVVAPLHGLELESSRLELGDGLALVLGDSIDAPPEAVWPEEGEGPATLCVLERHVSPNDPMPALEARQRFRSLITALRLYKPGGVTLGGLGWRRAAEGRWAAIEMEPTGEARGEPMFVPADEEAELLEFLGTIEHSTPRGAVTWALSRFEMGCSRPHGSEALSDYLLALRSLLDATSDAGRASLGLRLAALCAEEGQRRVVQRRVELAFSLERFVMRGGEGGLEKAIAAESPRVLVEELERHLRALLRDVLCGYLDADLTSVADDILLESPEPLEIEARDLRKERAEEAEPVTDELELVSKAQPRARRMAGFRPHREEPAPEQKPLPEPEPVSEPSSNGEPEGVTPSADWGSFDEDPESYSAPV